MQSESSSPCTFVSAHVGLAKGPCQHSRGLTDTADWCGHMRWTYAALCGLICKQSMFARGEGYRLLPGDTSPESARHPLHSDSMESFCQTKLRRLAKVLPVDGPAQRSSNRATV